MQLTPAMKGQLTKIVKANSGASTFGRGSFIAVKQVFSKIMPREQAKHAARNYLAMR